MFKSKAATGVMLAVVVCSSVFMNGIECAQGSEACVAWSYTTLVGIIALGIIALGTAVIWMVIGRK